MRVVLLYPLQHILALARKASLERRAGGTGAAWHLRSGNSSQSQVPTLVPRIDTTKLICTS